MLSIREQSWDELDRRHHQAQVAMETALLCSNEEVYQRAEQLEERYRQEKIRRQGKRSGPPSPEPVCADAVLSLNE